MRALAILLLSVTPCLSAEIHSKHLPYGLPTGDTRDERSGLPILLRA